MLQSEEERVFWGRPRLGCPGGGCRSVGLNPSLSFRRDPRAACLPGLAARRFDSGGWLSIFLRILFYLTRMSDDEIDNANSEQPLSYAPHHVWQYCAITNHTDAKKGGAKNTICAFCYKSFSGCSTFRAAARILGPECNGVTQWPPPCPRRAGSQ